MPDIKDILLKGNYITAEDLKELKDSDPEEYFLSHGKITKDILGQAKAEFYKLPYADLNTKFPPLEQVLLIPVALANSNRLVLFSQSESEVVITTDDPERANTALAQLKLLFPKKEIRFNYSLTEDIEACFVYYRKPLATRFSEIVATQTRIAPEIIEEIISDALVFKASDIHFEPQLTDVVVRFRVDGILHEAGRFSKEIYENILNRIKVLAHMRIDEHYSAQDGAIRFTREKSFVDVRVSIIPTLDGEKIAIRLLAEYVKGFTFSDLGVSEKDQKVFQEAIKNPFGMILVTGPTGSGKTTTLYALLKMLSQSSVNITTIEDPVEYRIPGVNSIQVNTQTNLTFAKGLRSIVRQDPDIILVGEIRDLETAEIAVNAALTGHLLFSTFHANDAATAIPRLLDMGIEPFLMASTLKLIIAQRLVRKICEHCRVSDGSDKKKSTQYKGKGCRNCNSTGYKGRTAIFEFIEVNEALQELILKHPSSREIWEVASKSGSRSLYEDGLEKVKNGTTTLDELTRVALPPK